jgi:hypothetical protein
MCELGSKKIPYVYNNSFVPQLTTLISMQKGQMFYTNTFVQVCPCAPSEKNKHAAKHIFFTRIPSSRCVCVLFVYITRISVSRCVRVLAWGLAFFVPALHFY